MHSRRRQNSVQLGVLLFFLGCGHTHQATDKPERDTDQHGGSADKAESAKSSSRTAHHGAREGAHASADKPPLAQAPAGLLQQGAVGQIQDKLSSGGYLKTKTQTGELDSSTEEALRVFQRDHNLPATGLPDAETVRLLGLSPDAVFRSAEPSK